MENAELEQLLKALQKLEDTYGIDTSEIQYEVEFIVGDMDISSQDRAG